MADDFGPGPPATPYGPGPGGDRPDHAVGERNIRAPLGQSSAAGRVATKLGTATLTYIAWMVLCLLVIALFGMSVATIVVLILLMGGGLAYFARRRREGEQAGREEADRNGPR